VNNLPEKPDALRQVGETEDAYNARSAKMQGELLAEPHLHFQVCDRPEPLACADIPVTFDDVTLPYAGSPRPLQSGDIVITH
jgi:hypothetical protein